MPNLVTFGLGDGVDIVVIPAVPVAGDAALPPGLSSGRRTLLGIGLVRPFVRTDRADFLVDKGAKLVRSRIGQVLGTVKGTLPWRPDFGSDLNRLRHKANLPIIRETAGVFVSDALTKWEPQANMRSIEVAPSPANQIVLKVSCGIFDTVVTTEVVI